MPSFPKEQVRLLQEEHHRSIDFLQRQLDSAEQENDRLQVKLQSVPTSVGVLTTSMMETQDTTDGSSVTEVIRDPRREERQSGEVGGVTGAKMCYDWWCESKML